MSHGAQRSVLAFTVFFCLLSAARSLADRQLQHDSHLKEIQDNWTRAPFPVVEKTAVLMLASTKPIPIQSNFISTGEIKSRIMPRLSSKEHDVMKAGFTFTNPLRVWLQKR